MVCDLINDSDLIHDGNLIRDLIYDCDLVLNMLNHIHKVPFHRQLCRF